MLNFKLSGMVNQMQRKPKNPQKHPILNCAGCGKAFRKNEKTVSYDFERYYCFSCDDKRQP